MIIIIIIIIIINDNITINNNSTPGYSSALPQLCTNLQSGQQGKNHDIAAVPWDANIESKYGEKVDHYKDLATELDSSGGKYRGDLRDV